MGVNTGLQVIRRLVYFLDHFVGNFKSAIAIIDGYRRYCIGSNGIIEAFQFGTNSIEWLDLRFSEGDLFAAFSRTEINHKAHG